jgi:hypothetical protein
MTTIFNRINTLILLLVLFALLSVIAMLATGARGGPLDPPGPPAASLPQVEPRSPIPPVGWNGTFPIVISQEGSYFLTRPLTGVANADGIQITSGSVSLDLNGFALTGVGQTGDGIAVIGLHAGIQISNGVVRDWLVGINGWDSISGQAVFSSVDRITALNNDVGITLGWDSQITNCNVSQNLQGIWTRFSVVRGCHATDNSDFGIYAEDVSLIEDNKAWNNGIGIWVNYSGARPNTVRSNTSTNNVNSDIRFDLPGNVSDSNVATCPAEIVGVAQTYNQMYQRDPC